MLANSSVSESGTVPFIDELSRFAQSFQVNLAELGQRGFLASPSAQPKAAAELQAIRKRLITSLTCANPESSNVVIISSVKDTYHRDVLAMNLAIETALEKTCNVLLADAILADGPISRVLNMSHLPGLIELVSRIKAKPEDNVLKTNIPELMLLPVGKGQWQKIAEGQVKRCFTLLKEYLPGLIIVDAPPLLSEYWIHDLAVVADQVVVVVETDRDSQAALSAALERMPLETKISLILVNSSQDLVISTL